MASVITPTKKGRSLLGIIGSIVAIFILAGIADALTAQPQPVGNQNPDPCGGGKQHGRIVVESTSIPYLVGARFRGLGCARYPNPGITAHRSYDRPFARVFTFDPAKTGTITVTANLIGKPADATITCSIYIGDTQEPAVSGSNHRPDGRLKTGLSGEIATCIWPTTK